MVKKMQVKLKKHWGSRLRGTTISVSPARAGYLEELGIGTILPGTPSGMSRPVAAPAEADDYDVSDILEEDVWIDEDAGGEAKVGNKDKKAAKKKGK